MSDGDVYTCRHCGTSRPARQPAGSQWWVTEDDCGCIKTGAVIQERAAAVQFIDHQFRSDYKLTRPKPNTHHYGRQELRELLDFIYGGPPRSAPEEIPKGVV